MKFYFILNTFFPRASILVYFDRLFIEVFCDTTLPFLCWGKTNVQPALYKQINSHHVSMIHKIKLSFGKYFFCNRSNLLRFSLRNVGEMILYSELSLEKVFCSIWQFIKHRDGGSTMTDNAAHARFRSNIKMALRYDQCWNKLWFEFRVPLKFSLK